MTIDERVKLLKDRLEIILCDGHLLPFDAGDEDVPERVRLLILEQFNALVIEERMACLATCDLIKVRQS